MPRQRTTPSVTHAIMLPMHVLITGGAGFVGSNLVRHTLATRPDADITVLDALTYAGHRSTLVDVADRIHLVHGRVEDPALVDALVGGLGPDGVIIHLAAESHNDRSIACPDPFVETNLVGTFHVLEAVRRHDVRLHHVSTDEVYGDLPLDDAGPGFAEGDPYRPSSPYAATKAGADHLVHAWVRTYGVRATISNSGNNLGPWQHPEKLIPHTITTLLAGRPAELYGTGRNVRDWLHVEDHCRAIWAIIDHGRIGEGYGVSAGLRRDNREIVAGVALALADAGVALPDPVTRLVDDRPGHDLRLAIDASRLRDELGWRPRHTDLDAQLRETVAWYLSHEAWWRPLAGGVE